MKAAFDLLDTESGPVLEEFEDDTVPQDLLQASGAERSEASKCLNPADELTALRPYYERWVERNGGRTAVGVSGVPQRRFRGVVRFLEAYTAGEGHRLRRPPRRRGCAAVRPLLRRRPQGVLLRSPDGTAARGAGQRDSRVVLGRDGHERHDREAGRDHEPVPTTAAVKAIPYGLAR